MQWHPLIFMVSSPLQYQEQAPTREASEAMLDSLVERYSSSMDANDLIYAFDASRFYNPAPHLRDIRAPPARAQLRRRPGQSAGTRPAGKAH